MSTLILYPTSDSLKTNWTGKGDATNLYANVDETTKNEADYNKCITANSPILYGFGNHTSESGTISKITQKSWLRCGSTIDTNKMCNKIGSTIYYGTGFSLETGIYTYLKTREMTVRPSDSQSWEWSDVDDFLGGCVLTTSNKDCALYDYMSWVEVDYTAGGGTSIINHILTRKPFRHMLIR